MPRSDEAQAFFHAVYSAVQEIPPGKVTSYGHIARLVGTPQRPRQVGVCLKHLPNLDDWNQAHAEGGGEERPRFHHDNVPWQRVVNAKGGISPRSQPSATLNQAAALEAEGVVVTRDALGELSVDLKTYGWFPRILPSAAERGEVPDDSDSGSDEGEGEGNT
ncbi:6-O-methylguanine DNA methyltransferase [Schizothecium vesticola]|uniref:6-O-methylguanine DNA methyltransferase n=1 Tax=Schizothecium vesticola TaxID=314040 RepID=A0AA40JZ07_9PEZI|nr:6-O-methylguanine DNA methyltransferase [Schizothecium vesticola]